ncbi:hypothetical protein Clacol_006399 [Clathrus columnatus]|uniref:Ribosome biogenesis protein NSA1 n=1 Tax=Clathrus columnatus TaxID=1419009 RepID=A0AAV5AGA3_9AGAM|nr:hypothetical protein Clacol_006399 [Clathrus columnatus]
MRFFLGDDNGQLKVAKCIYSNEEWKVDLSVIDNCIKSGREKAIQRLAVYQHDKISLAHMDGSLSLLHVSDTDEPPALLKDWKESRFKPEEKFVGLAFTNQGDIISCTNNGHLSLMQQTGVDMDNVMLKNTLIPKRLCDWKLSFDSKNFIFGGEEVEVSLWDTERAFDPSRNVRKHETLSQLPKKRKSKTLDLLEGEIWRAKNVSNDFLNLRQPVHNTALTFVPLSNNPTSSSFHILSGTRLGSVRRYDTRVARKPIADWKDVSRSGIMAIEKGNIEYEAFVSDCGSNLTALDLRTGRILHTYAGLAGTISSIASTSSPKPSLIASTSLDRYFRVHGTDRESDKKPEVLSKTWTKTIPTCVAWDGRLSPVVTVDEDEENADTIWNGIQVVGENSDLSDNEEEEESFVKKRRKL